MNRYFPPSHQTANAVRIYEVLKKMRETNKPAGYSLTHDKSRPKRS